MENNNTSIKDNLLGHTNQNTLRRFFCCIFHKSQDNDTDDNDEHDTDYNDEQDTDDNDEQDTYYNDEQDTDDDMDKYIPTWSINKGTFEK